MLDFKQVNYFLIGVISFLICCFCTQLVGALHDKMTQCRYVKPLETFNLGIVPEPWFEVDVLNRGRKALEEVNSKLGEREVSAFFLLSIFCSIIVNSWRQDFVTMFDILYQKQYYRGESRVILSMDLAMRKSDGTI